MNRRYRSYTQRGYRSNDPLYNRFQSFRSIGNAVSRGVRSIGRSTLFSAASNLANMAARSARTRSFYRNRGLFGSGSRFAMKSNSVNNNVKLRGRRKKMVYVKSKVGMYKRKPMNSGQNPYDLYGSTQVIETPSVYEGDTASAIYVGHGVANQPFWLSVCRALVRKLFHMAGQQIEDWNKTPELTGASVRAINYWYSTLEDPKQYSTGNVGILTTDTYNQIANTLLVAFQTIFTSSDEHIQLYRIAMSQTVSATPVTVASLDLTNVYVHYKLSSKLTIQNVSLAGKAVTPEADDNVITNIEDNPLKGKIYETKYRANGFRVETIQATNLVNSTSLVADKDTGLIRIRPRNTAGADESLATFIRKPPAGKFFNAQAHNISMKAGEIKTFSFKDKRTISLHKLINLLQKGFADDFTTLISAGYAQMVGLEKMMNVVDVNPEWPIKVHIQLEQTYGSYVTATRSTTPRLIAINPTVV